MTEQATFCGIEIPLTMECLLRVFGQAVDKRAWLDDYYDEKMTRQVNAFRARILRMDAEKGEEIAGRRKAMANLGIQIHEWADKHYEAKRRIAELEKSLDLRDEALGDANKSIDRLEKRIAELEKELDKLYKEKSNRGAAIRNM